MVDRFACIGIDVTGPGGVEAAVTALLGAAGETVYRGGGSVFEWRDPSGAGLLVTTVTVDNVVQCVTPTLTSGRLVTVVPGGFGADDDCRFCQSLLVDVVDDEGRPVTPLAVRLEDSALSRPRLPMGDAVTMAVSGLVEQLRMWPDEAAYDAAQAASRTPFASRALVATGRFGTGGSPTPHAVVTGHVTATATRVNESTGRPFRWMTVDTLGGTFELASAPDGPEVEVGNVVQALCWMVGRVVVGLADRPLPRRLRR